jgi:hypothetical protein
VKPHKPTHREFSRPGQSWLVGLGLDADCSLYVKSCQSLKKGTPGSRNGRKAPSAWQLRLGGWSLWGLTRQVRLLVGTCNALQNVHRTYTPPPNLIEKSDRHGTMGRVASCKLQVAIHRCNPQPATCNKIVFVPALFSLSIRCQYIYGMTPSCCIKPRAS